MRVWRKVKIATEPSEEPHASIASPRLVAELSARNGRIRELTSAVLREVPRRPGQVCHPSVSNLGFFLNRHSFFRFLVPGCIKVTRAVKFEDRWTYLRKVTEPARLPTANKDTSTSGAGS